MPFLDSKLPQVGMTIFTVMSQLAQTHGALNLSQGFPDFDPPARLRELVNDAMRVGRNQYAPMSGLPALREAIADKTEALYGVLPDAEHEITVTSGATEALFCALAAVVRSGDEVIIFDPAYDSYEPVITLLGGFAKRVPLQYPGYCIDWDRLRGQVNRKTRLLVLNSPHNPTGQVLHASDIKALQALAVQHDFFILADEVYEHIIFDGNEHLSLLRAEDLRERTFVVSSFGKTYHCTGWKLGYCIAPRAMSAEFRKIHQYNTFASFTPIQFAFAAFLQEAEHYSGLPVFYQAKRDYFLNAMRGSRFKALPCQGTYFQLFDYSEISGEHDQHFAERLIREHGVAAIPVSVFYGDGQDNKVLRFCFAKSEALLSQAAERLCAI